MRHLSQSGHWPSGNPRFYYRPKGQKGMPMPDAPIDSPEFRAAYAAKEGTRPTYAPAGSLSAAIEEFQTSPEFAERATSTQRMWARTLDDLREKYGNLPFDGIRTRHIKADLSNFPPNPANNRAKAWKALFRYMEDIGRVEVDPARPIRKRKTPASDGFTAWTRDDFAAFRAHWPHETRERLAFEVYYRSCASTVDAVRLGPGMVDDGWLVYQRSKSRSLAVIPWTSAAPDWFEWTDDLERCETDHMVWMATVYGRPRSHKAASSWFAAACRAAGLDLSAHGIRKGRAAVFRENGATAEQRMAILGHETEGEATAYSRSADLRRVIDGHQAATVTRIRRRE